jgi:hypothetical protein
LPGCAAESWVGEPATCAETDAEPRPDVDVDVDVARGKAWEDATLLITAETIATTKTISHACLAERLDDRSRRLRVSGIADSNGSRPVVVITSPDGWAFNQGL